MNQRVQSVWKRMLDRIARRTRVGSAATEAVPSGANAAGAGPAAELSLQCCATVVIPALNEAARIADVVRYAMSDPATAEVIVIDDSSIDDTAELARAAGAHVVTSTMLGKGASMRDGLEQAQRDLLVYLDGDLAGLRPDIVSDLCRPLLAGEADFVKARFGRGGGRVTELTAKPMLKVFFPELAHIAQPLGGIIAARRALLQTLDFETGYGVDVGLLLDAHAAGAKVVEIDIGSLEHDSQPLLDLAVMANEVSRVIYSRARAAGRFHVEQISAMYETQRQAVASIDYVLTRRRGRQKLLLMDMDGTITEQRFVVELARATGREEKLAGLLDGKLIDSSTRSEAIAALFRFVHRKQFEDVASAITLRPGVIGFVNRMRRNGFMVGLVSDSYLVAAEILRRRIFADFAMAHTLQFDGDVCNGHVHINPAFLPVDKTAQRAVSKRHVLQRFKEDVQQPAVTETWAVGDNANDLGMLELADRAFALDPKTSMLMSVPGIVRVSSFDELSEIAFPGQAMPTAV